VGALSRYNTITKHFEPVSAERVYFGLVILYEPYDAATAVSAVQMQLLGQQQRPEHPAAASNAMDARLAIFILYCKQDA
jgi:hypothetical protein